MRQRNKTGGGGKNYTTPHILATKQKKNLSSCQTDKKIKKKNRWLVHKFGKKPVYVADTIHRSGRMHLKFGRMQLPHEGRDKARQKLNNGGIFRKRSGGVESIRVSFRNDLGSKVIDGQGALSIVEIIFR